MVPKQVLEPGCQSWTHYFWSWMLETTMSSPGTDDCSNWVLTVAAARVNSQLLVFVSLASHSKFWQRTESAGWVLSQLSGGEAKELSDLFVFCHERSCLHSTKTQIMGIPPKQRMALQIPGSSTTTIKEILVL